MYRLLEVGEVIENGDEYYGIEDKWLGFPPSCVGMKTVPHDAPIRRLVKHAVTPADSKPAIDPGEGYRLIDKAVDKPERWDEIWDSVHWKHRGHWFECREYNKNNVYRRKLPAVAPVISVGDRVKVLSGTWAGCTGVVLSLDYPQGRTVLLDNVFVGGDRLTVVVLTQDVEKLSSVVPEVLYRDLSHRETIRETDQHIWNNWETVSAAAGQKLNSHHCRIRRAVRIQSPGWRYLDAGETVQAGDEVWCQTDRNWQRLMIMCESKVANEKLFRRKLPANVGG